MRPSISCRCRSWICRICCRLCWIESDEFAHTASTSWRVCWSINRRCCIADLATPATCQQGSTRGGLVVGPVAVGGRRTTTCAPAFSASAAESMIPASSAASTVLLQDIKSLLRRTQTQRSAESRTVIVVVPRLSEKASVRPRCRRTATHRMAQNECYNQGLSPLCCWQWARSSIGRATDS